MDIARITTTQNVVIQFETAGVGERFTARLLDIIFMGAYALIITWITSFAISGLDGDVAEAFAPVALLLMLPVMTYTLWTESLFGGRSFGKMMMGIKVVRSDGSPAGIGDFAIRWITRLLECEAALFPGLAALISIISNRGQRIGDMAADTIVIRVNQKTSLRSTILSYVHPNYRIVFPQVERFNDRDMGIIREIMLQSFETSNYALLARLSHKVKEQLGVYPQPQQLPDLQFLNIVIADYTHIQLGVK
jgi:uncharacterized RDD family membrane protein YckC